MSVGGLGSLSNNKFELEGLDKVLSAFSRIEKQMKHTLASQKEQTKASKESAAALEEMNKAGKLAQLKHGLELAKMAADAAKASFKKLWDVMKAGADASEAWQRLTARGINSTLVAQMDAITGSVIETTQLQRLALRGTSLGLSEQDMSDLGRVSAVLSQDTGKNTADVYEQVVDALGRGRVTMLAQYGIQLDQKTILEDYAGRLGKTTDELTVQQKTQALIEQLVKKTKDRQVELNTQMMRMRQFSKAAADLWSDVTERVSDLFLGSDVRMTDNIANVEKQIENLRGKLMTTIPGTGWLTDYTEKIGKLSDHLEYLEARQRGAKEGLSLLTDGYSKTEAMAFFALRVKEIDEKVRKLKDAYKDGRVPFSEYIQKMYELARASTMTKSALDAVRNSVKKLETETKGSATTKPKEGDKKKKKPSILAQLLQQDREEVRKALVTKVPITGTSAKELARTTYDEPEGFRLPGMGKTGSEKGLAPTLGPTGPGGYLPEKLEETSKQRAPYKIDVQEVQNVRDFGYAWLDATASLKGYIDQSVLANDTLAKFSEGISAVTEASKKGVAPAIAASSKIAGAFIKNKAAMAAIAMLTEAAAAAASFALGDIRGGILHTQASVLYGIAAAVKGVSGGGGGGTGGSVSAAAAATNLRNSALSESKKESPVNINYYINAPVIGDQRTIGRIFVSSANEAVAHDPNLRFDARIVGVG